MLIELLGHAMSFINFVNSYNTIILNIIFYVLQIVGFTMMPMFYFMDVGYTTGRSIKIDLMLCKHPMLLSVACFAVAVKYIAFVEGYFVPALFFIMLCALNAFIYIYTYLPIINRINKIIKLNEECNNINQ